MVTKNKKILSTSINKKTSLLMESINSSIDTDSRLFNQDLSVTKAHALSLHKLKIINKVEYNKIQNGLEKINKLYKLKKIKFSRQNEDIHMNIESLLHEIIGDTAYKIHTGRSRNDQVAADTRLWVIESSNKLKKELLFLMNRIIIQAETNYNKIIPGFTHLQVAQPVTLGHHLLAYYEMFKRDLEHLDFVISAANENPLGSAALAGSNYNIDTNLVNKVLGFNKSKKNSLDGVSDRDFCVYFLQATSMVSLHLGKFSSELILWSSNLFKFFDISKNYSTGSSIMPQKRNPDSLELIRGKTNIIRNKSMDLMNMLSNLPLTYFKDFQEDKKIIFDTYDDLTLCLQVLSEVIKESKFTTNHALKICEENYASATDLADYLVIEKRIAFRESYKIIASIVDYAQKQKKSMHEIELEEFKKFNKNIDKNIYHYIDIQKSVLRKKTSMSTHPSRVKQAIKNAKSYIIRRK